MAGILFLVLLFFLGALVLLRSSMVNIKMVSLLLGRAASRESLIL